jgi:large subunit ribosomal protein L6e
MPRIHSSRNHELVRGVFRYSRSAMFRRSGRWAIKKKLPIEKKKPEVKPIIKPFGKKNETREIKKKSPRFYPTEDVSRPIASRKSHHRPTRLRPSITPGTVLIIVSGRFRGKRVVFLKQLPSGLLLVTGPYKFNGVPLRRVNQAYVIATSTKLPEFTLDSKLNEKLNDSFFKRVKKEKKKTEEQFFAEDKKKKEISAERIAAQKEVDKVLMEVIKKQKFLREYLQSKFSLSRKQFPHEMKF